MGTEKLSFSLKMSDFVLISLIFSPNTRTENPCVPGSIPGGTTTAKP
jgi:hypothetical protein